MTVVTSILNFVSPYSTQRNGILITTYGTIQTSWEDLGADSSNRQFTWDYIILDEGHKIKNHTNKTSKVRTVWSELLSHASQ